MRDRNHQLPRLNDLLRIAALLALWPREIDASADPFASRQPTT